MNHKFHYICHVNVFKFYSHLHFRHIAYCFANRHPSSCLRVILLNLVAIDGFATIIFRSLPFKCTSILVDIRDL